MPDTPFGKKMGMQDWVGIVAFTAFCSCFCMAGSFGGTLYAWNSGSEIALWVMTFVLFIAFVLVTVYHPFVPADSRLMPVHFMRTKDLIIVPLQAFLVAGSMMMSIYYTPLIFQFTRGDSPLMAGVRILPLISMIVFGCLFNGFAMPKFGYYMPWFVVGNAMLVAGAALMSMWDDLTSQRSDSDGLTAEQQQSRHPSRTPHSTDTRCSSVWESAPSKVPALASPVHWFLHPKSAMSCQS
jgi:MFS family permease